MEKATPEEIQNIKIGLGLWKMIVLLATGLGVLTLAFFKIGDTRYATQEIVANQVNENMKCIAEIKKEQVEQDKTAAAQNSKIELLGSDIKGTLKEIRVELQYMRKERE